MAENTTNLNGFLKDTYANSTTAQSGKGFAKLSKHKKCAKCGKMKNIPTGKICNDCLSKKGKG
jgi:hypothetical protein